MFTGIIEAALPLASVRPTVGWGVRLGLEFPSHFTALKLGDSIAINGVCLTVASLSGLIAGFDAIPETMRLTNLGDLRPGDVVNVERALAAGSRMDGHMVQGHVDTTGTIESISVHGDEWRLRVNAEGSFCDQCVLKGSVCLDGISLTIAELGAAHLTVAIIPHTRKVTNLATRRSGQRVNLEADIIGKYVKRQLAQIFEGLGSGGLSTEVLRKHGFLAGS